MTVGDVLSPAPIAISSEETSVRELPNYAGMTVSERLRSADLTEQWAAAVLSGNRPRMLELLRKVDLEDKADWIIETVLANPQQYGF